jgi:hypothetical protein
VRSPFHRRRPDLDVLAAQNAWRASWRCDGVPSDQRDAACGDLALISNRVP